MNEELETAKLLYIFFDHYVPKFLVSLDPRLDQLRLLDFRTRPLHSQPWQDYDRLHDYLHRCYGTKCRKRINDKLSRSGTSDSPFSSLVRLGPEGTGGCKDTPLIDIDVCLVQDDRIYEIWERKNKNERYDDAAVKVHEWLRNRGVAVLEDRR